MQLLLKLKLWMLPSDLKPQEHSCPSMPSPARDRVDGKLAKTLYTLYRPRQMPLLLRLRLTAARRSHGCSLPASIRVEDDISENINLILGRVPSRVSKSMVRRFGNEASIVPMTSTLKSKIRS